MTTKQVIDSLINKGHAVKYFIRSDGSARITEIDGQKFTASKGNTKARQMVGASLSKRQMQQLNRNVAQQKGKKKKKKKNPEPSEAERNLRKRLRRAQRIARESEKDGTITWKQVEYTWKHFGTKEAEERLTQFERYMKGIAYPINLEHFIERLEQQKPMEKPYGRSLIFEVQTYIRQRINAEWITEYQLQKLIELWYDYISGTLNAHDWHAKSMGVLERHTRESTHYEPQGAGHKERYNRPKTKGTSRKRRTVKG